MMSAMMRLEQTMLLVFLRSSMEVNVDSEVYQCLSGDKLIIPGGSWP